MVNYKWHIRRDGLGAASQKDILGKIGTLVPLNRQPLSYQRSAEIQCICRETPGVMYHVRLGKE
jgi:hypothetical protein